MFQEVPYQTPSEAAYSFNSQHNGRATITFVEIFFEIRLQNILFPRLVCIKKLLICLIETISNKSIATNFAKKHHTTMLAHSTIDAPLTMQEALQSSNAKEWEQAIQFELEFIEKNQNGHS